MAPEWITLIMFGGMMILLVLGTPIGFALGGIALALAFVDWGPESLIMGYFSTMNVMGMFSLACAPMFIFMGLLLTRSGIAEEMYRTLQWLLDWIPGSLAVTTVVVSTVLAAMVGGISAATITMGLVALPIMLKLGYNKGIAIGCIQAGAALGFLIPPSVVAVIYALIAKVSIGKLFAAGLFPGLMLAGMFIIYIIIRCRIQPHLAPRLSKAQSLPTAEQPVIPTGQQPGTPAAGESPDVPELSDTAAPKARPAEVITSFIPATRKEKLRALLGLLPPVIVIVVMMGTIFMGIATPVEASAMGAAATLIVVIAKRRFSKSLLTNSLQQSVGVGGAIIWIFVGAMLFSAIYDGLGAKEIIEDLLLGSGLGPWAIIALMMVSWFIMGAFLDDYAILFICAPVYLPIIESLGFNPIWFGVLYMLNMQMAYLTPPFGYCLFMMKSVAPPDVTMTDIYRSTGPFVLIQAVGLILCIAFPQIIMWFPNMLFG